MLTKCQWSILTSKTSHNAACTSTARRREVKAILGVPRPTFWCLQKQIFIFHKSASKPTSPKSQIFFLICLFAILPIDAQFLILRNRFVLFHHGTAASYRFFFPSQVCLLWISVNRNQSINMILIYFTFKIIVIKGFIFGWLRQQVITSGRFICQCTTRFQRYILRNQTSTETTIWMPFDYCSYICLNAFSFTIWLYSQRHFWLYYLAIFFSEWSTKHTYPVLML